MYLLLKVLGAVAHTQDVQCLQSIIKFYSTQFDGVNRFMHDDICGWVDASYMIRHRLDTYGKDAHEFGNI